MQVASTTLLLAHRAQLPYLSLPLTMAVLRPLLALRWPLVLLLGAAVTVCAQEAYEPTLKWLSSAQIEEGLQVGSITTPT